MLFMFTGLLRGPAAVTVALVMIGLGLASIGWCHRRAAAIFREAKSADLLLCPTCLYDLRELEERGSCPECGRPYEHTSVQIRWVDAEQHHRLWRDSQHDSGSGG